MLRLKLSEPTRPVLAGLRGPLVGGLGAHRSLPEPVARGSVGHQQQIHARHVIAAVLAPDGHVAPRVRVVEHDADRIQLLDGLQDVAQVGHAVAVGIHHRKLLVVGLVFGFESAYQRGPSRRLASNELRRQCTEQCQHHHRTLAHETAPP